MDTDQVQAGKRLRPFVLKARNEAHIKSWAELARQAGLSRSTLTDWWKGDAKPTRSSLKALAPVIHRTVDELEAAYYGRPPSGYVTRGEFDAVVGRMEATLAEALRRLREDRGE